MEFKELNLLEYDKNLTEQEKAEWHAIYASYRSGSVISGDVVGVDLHEFKFVPKGKKRAVSQSVRCLIIINYRVKIIIPENEVFLEDFDSGYHILHSMYGTSVDYVITYIDREAGFAVASRKRVLTKLRSVTARHGLKAGQIIEVKVLSVGRGVCTVHFGGYDILMPQRDVSYSIVPDLREAIHPGEIKKAVVKEYDKDNHTLKISIKELTPHPFDGIEMRHPLKATRIGKIVGKYGGGVFCRLYDQVTDVLCSYVSMQYDGDFNIGDKVEVIITKYNTEKKLVYGKILRKMY